MGLGVHLLDVLGVDAGLNGIVSKVQHWLYFVTYGNVLGEVFLVLLLVFLGQSVHVVSDVAAEDVALVHISVELTISETGESLGRVGDVQTGISGALENAEDAGTGGGAGKTGVQVATERSLV